MGKISRTGSSSAAPRFQLDSAFDDNFDVNAAKEEFEPVSQLPAPAVNGSPQGPPRTTPDFSAAFTPSPSVQNASPKPQEPSKPAFSFDDAFGSVAPPQVPPRPSQPSPGDLGISFEDAFGGGGNQALALNFSPQPAPSGAATLPRQSDETTSQRIQSPPRSPQVTATASSPPVARSSTPPPRRSTGSSTDGSVHAKPPPQHRHSKLSVRPSL